MTEQAKPKGKRGAHFTPEVKQWAQSNHIYEYLNGVQGRPIHISLSEASIKAYLMKVGPRDGLAFESARQWSCLTRKGA